MINLDNNSPKAIYEQIYDEIERLILSKVLKPEDKLPSVRELASMVKINPNTIQKAYKTLEDNNYIYSVKGVGNFVQDAGEIRNIYLKNKKDELYKVVESLKILGLNDGDIMEEVKEALKQSIKGGGQNVDNEQFE